MNEILQNIKLAVGVIVGMVGTGVLTVLEMIPNDIGKVGFLLSAVLTSVLIFVHLRKSHDDHQRHKLEIEMLMKKEERRAKRPSCCDKS